MSEKFLSFEGGGSLSQRQKKLYAEGRGAETVLKKLCFLSSAVVFSGFFCLKVFHKSRFFWGQRQQATEISDKIPSSKQSKKAYTLPLLVNLKGRDGPQLTRVHVHITYSKNHDQKNILSQKHLLKKQALFVLSGKSVKSFQDEKSHFEKQILSQLNVFLSKDLIEGVRIQTHRKN